MLLINLNCNVFSFNRENNVRPIAFITNMPSLTLGLTLTNSYSTWYRWFCLRVSNGKGVYIGGVQVQPNHFVEAGLVWELKFSWLRTPTISGVVSIHAKVWFYSFRLLLLVKCKRTVFGRNFTSDPTLGLV